MQCRTIRTHYSDTVSFNHRTIADWERDKLPMVVQDIETGQTLGIITWDWFMTNHGKSYKKHPTKMFRIQVSSFMAVQPMKPRVILRKARS